MKNKLRMYKAVKTVFSVHQTSWTGLPALVTAHDAFTEKLTQLETLGDEQDLKTSGVTKHKHMVHEATAKAVLKIAKGLRVYALENNLVELSENLNFTLTDVLHRSEIKASHLFNFVLEKAEELIAELADYNITPARLAEVQALSAEFETLRFATRDAVIERKFITSSINAIEEEMDALLKDKVDLLMATLETEHKKFFSQYFNARHIVKFGFGGFKGESEVDGDAPIEGNNEPDAA